MFMRTKGTATDASLSCELSPSSRFTFCCSRPSDIRQPQPKTSKTCSHRLGKSLYYLSSSYKTPFLKHFAKFNGPVSFLPEASNGFLNPIVSGPFCLSSVIIVTLSILLNFYLFPRRREEMEILCVTAVQYSRLGSLGILSGYVNGVGCDTQPRYICGCPGQVLFKSS
ncbi:hypothetical protein B0H65DRAFT_253010 [Neurospora tetraspora]|uniref:Uncharacterized protein n=1 Tax=Neurospora tetraspora TaxID=94610 RepID=A0AAE0MPY0_9PEZI|nr:hypothetical protein B0H65DRAFT_253010 [Neurospora tetraspora]